MSGDLTALDPDQLIAETLVDEESLQARITELGEDISRDYRGREPLLVGVLKGVSIFMADLIREMPIQLGIDFMSISALKPSSQIGARWAVVRDVMPPSNGPRSTSTTLRPASASS